VLAQGSRYASGEINFGGPKDLHRNFETPSS
jgi:hypothetical protein